MTTSKPVAFWPYRALARRGPMPESAAGTLRVVWRNRAFRALVVGETVSVTGTQMSALALPWFVLRTSGSAVTVSAVIGAQLVALLLAGVPSGELAHRYGIRKTMLLSNLFAAVLTALIPALHAVGLLSVPVLISVAFCLGIAISPYFACRQSLLPELLGEDEVAFRQGMALFQMAFRTASWFGPAVGGVLIVWASPTAVLLVDASTFLLAFAVLTRWVNADTPRTGALERIRLLRGVRFLLQNRLIGALALGQALSQTAYQGLLFALPILAYRSYAQNARTAGLLLAGWGLGSFLGSVWSLRSKANTNAVRVTVITWFLQSLPLWLLVVPVPAAVAVLIVLMSGAANGIRVPAMMGVWAVSTPRHVRPQSMSAMATLGTAFSLGAVAGSGLLLDTLGLGPVFLLVALTSTAGAVTFLRVARRVTSPRSDSDDTEVEVASPTMGGSSQGNANANARSGDKPRASETSRYR